MSKRVIVIGGGASGLMAAARAAELGADILVVEKTDRLGSKLRLTGGGHCNLANDCTVKVFLQHLDGESNFLRNALARFFVPELRETMGRFGIETLVEPDGRIFPVGRNAHQVVTALRKHAIAHGAHFRYGSPVKELVVEEGRIRGVRIGDQVIHADAAILATGGITYPATGSTGDGYYLAQSVGHELAPLKPGLVPLIAQEADLKSIEGVSLRNVAVDAYVGDKPLAHSRGDLVFTAMGLSGPAILNMSGQLVDALEQRPLRLTIDLAPDLSSEKVDQRVQEQLGQMGRLGLRRLLEAWIPPGLAPWLAQRIDIAINQPLHQLSAVQRRRIVAALKTIELTITAIEPAAKGMITLGGVRCTQIEPQTMASRLVQGLYIVGELLNVAGDSGGFNLQIAFTTGFLAGESAGKLAAEQVLTESTED